MALVVDPSVISSDHLSMLTTWQLMRAIMGGTEAMRIAGQAYLPKYEGESETSYQNRLQKTVLTNYFEDALRNAVSLPFRKPIEVPEGLPSDLKDITQDIDMMGNDLDQFSRIALEDSTIMGFGFIMVDWARNEAENLLQQKLSGADRPYWIFIKADDVLACYTDIVEGKERITHLRYVENRTVVDDNYQEKLISQIRVYKPGSFEVWQSERIGNSIEVNSVGGHYKMVDGGELRDKNGNLLPFVPVVPLWAGRRLGGFRVKPLFEDLAYKQVEHWQSSSDQRNILTFARFPMLAVAGTQGSSEDELVVGPSRVLTTVDVEGRWYYVEPRGYAIETGRRDLEDLKEEMRILGLQPLMSARGNITATARALDETRVHSAVQVLAMNLEDSIETAMRYTALWMGIKRDENERYSIKVNRDFGLSIRESAEVDSMIRARIAGEISRKTFWDELKRRNVLSPDFDGDEEEKRLEQEFLTGKIPFSVAAKLPALPKVEGEGEISRAMNLRSTLNDVEADRNTAFNKGRSPIGSQGAKGRPAV